MELKYRTIMWAEMSPDVYDGPNCDEHSPRWETYCEGDKGGSEFLFGDIILDPATFPPGTKIEISVPLCPKCETEEEMHDNNICDFNWRQWTEEKYS